MVTGTIVDRANLPGHSHHRGHVAHVLDGEFELTIDAPTHRMGPGDTTIIPANAPHSGRSITTYRVVDTFPPVRDNFR